MCTNKEEDRKTVGFRNIAKCRLPSLAHRAARKDQQNLAEFTLIARHSRARGGPPIRPTRAICLSRLGGAPGLLAAVAISAGRRPF
jgi:hypothetical protein